MRRLPLDCDLPTQIHVPKFIAKVSTIRDASEKISKLENYINQMQDEMNKIDAFRRELPLCMFLLNDAIAAAKEELMKLKKSKLKIDPVLEEFIPLKKIGSDEEEKDKSQDDEDKDSIKTREKMNWMSSAQLWSSDHQNHHQNTQKKRKEDSMIQLAIDDLFSISKNTGSGMTFGGFEKFSNFPKTKKEGRDEFAVLTLRTPEIKEAIQLSSKSGSSGSQSTSAANEGSNFTIRKQRRCWSRELHRRFVNALQHLGGAQAATPRQIRELMQVDGLTNDEVKSHLQKYRLHTRTVKPSTTNAPAAATQPGVSWKARKSSKTSNSQSGSPPGPLHLTTSIEEDDEEDVRSESQSHLSVRNVA